MGEIVQLKTSHPLVGTWGDAREDGTSVRFTIRAAGSSFEVTGVDTYDGEVLSISNVEWDGRVLRFHSLVPSNGHRVEYELETLSASEVRVRYTTVERWVRIDSTE